MDVNELLRIGSDLMTEQFKLGLNYSQEPCTTYIQEGTGVPVRLPTTLLRHDIKIDPSPARRLIHTIGNLFTDQQRMPLRLTSTPKPEIWSLGERLVDESRTGSLEMNPHGATLHLPEESSRDSEISFSVPICLHPELKPTVPDLENLLQRTSEIINYEHSRAVKGHKTPFRGYRVKVNEMAQPLYRVKNSLTQRNEVPLLLMTIAGSPYSYMDDEVQDVFPSGLGTLSINDDHATIEIKNKLDNPFNFECHFSIPHSFLGTN